jgi:hypothetical protein
VVFTIRGFLSNQHCFSGRVREGEVFFLSLLLIQSWQIHCLTSSTSSLAQRTYLTIISADLILNSLKHRCPSITGNRRDAILFYSPSYSLTHGIYSPPDSSKYAVSASKAASRQQSNRQ